MITPKELRKDTIEEFGAGYHITSIRRILHRLNMSARTGRRVYV